MGRQTNGRLDRHTEGRTEEQTDRYMRSDLSIAYRNIVMLCSPNSYLSYSGLYVFLKYFFISFACKRKYHTQKSAGFVWLAGSVHVPHQCTVSLQVLHFHACNMELNAFQTKTKYNLFRYLLFLSSRFECLFLFIFFFCDAHLHHAYVIALPC